MSDPGFLCLQLKRIGDTILTAPAIAALHDAFPSSPIALVVDRTAQDIAACIPGLRGVHAFHRDLSDLALVAGLVGRRPRAVLDFTGNDRSALLTAIARSPRRILYARHCTSPWRRRLYTDQPDASVRDLHTIDYHLALLEPLGIRDASRQLRLVPGPDAIRTAESLVDGLADFWILHPGSARREKYWLPDRWAALANQCFDRTGWTCVMTGTADPFEREQIAAIRAGLKGPVRDLSGRTALPVLLALLKRARLLLGVDSAPMHLAGAVDTPQIALFGPTNPFHWRPLSARAVVLQAGNPGSTFTDPRRPGQPMAGLRLDEVSPRLEELLASLESPARP